MVAMSEQHDVYYTAEFIDGPRAAESEERVLIHGKHDVHLNVVSLVDGLESIFKYTEVDQREVQGKLHVRYSFSENGSDPFVSEDENE